MKSWVIVGLSFLSLLSGPALGAPDFKSTPEEVAKSVVAICGESTTPRQALLELFRIPASALEANELVQLIEKSRWQYSGSLDTCAANLKNIGTALGMYAVDFNGEYPSELADLIPNYLQAIPKCPAAKTDTYSASYTVATDNSGFSFCCSGHHHQLVAAAGQPSYSAKDGLQGLPEMTLPISRILKVVEIEVAPDGNTASIRLEETIRANLDLPPIVGECTMIVERTEQGWWLSGSKLPPAVQANVDKLLGLSVLNKLGAPVDPSLGDSLQSGEGNLLELTPLQHMVVVWQAESSPAYQALQTLEYEPGLSSRVEELRYLGDRIALYRERHGQWPANVEDVFGAELMASSSMLRDLSLEIAPDGQTVIAFLPESGFKLLDIPASYPRVEISQEGGVTVLYRP